MLSDTRNRHVKLRTWLKQFGVSLVPAQKSEEPQHQKQWTKRSTPFIRSWSVNKCNKVMMMLPKSGGIQVGTIFFQNKKKLLLLKWKEMKSFIKVASPFLKRHLLNRSINLLLESLLFSLKSVPVLTLRLIAQFTCRRLLFCRKPSH